MGMFYVFLFKNFLTPERQELFDEMYELSLEDPQSQAMRYVAALGRDTYELEIRLLEYFYTEKPDYVVSLHMFPLLEFEKEPKMDLCYQSLDNVKPDILRDKVLKYLSKLDLEELKVPPPDCLYKIGNQKYNDEGVVRYDHERPLYSFDSGFLYQRFITQPLTPREVWLPGKAIKFNNTFWMTLGRQFLKKDPRYPRSSFEETWEAIKDKVEDTLRFDLSGFGFQFPRSYLVSVATAIEELYPATRISEQREILERIVSNVTVQMPSGEVIQPPRGIGLGYYEDLKTITIMAILDEYNPISLYGDQGLMPFSMFVDELKDFGFLFTKDSKIQMVASAPEHHLKWGGWKVTPTYCLQPKARLSSLMGALFSRYHWQRKIGLRGILFRDPEWYRMIESRLSFAYELIFGHEFFRGESYSSFYNAGIRSNVPITEGVIRTWKAEHMTAPVSSLWFDTTYQTPFKSTRARLVSDKEAYLFSKRRKKVYKESVPTDNSVYLYSNPRITYNMNRRPGAGFLPAWADLLHFVSHGSHTGTITSGLSPEEQMLAINRQVFSSDPFRARSTGGYEIITQWRSTRGASAEWYQLCQVLACAEKADLLLVRRADLHQHPNLSEDPLYRESNLIDPLYQLSRKRKRDDEDVSSRSEKLRREVLEALPGMISTGGFTSLQDLSTLVEYVENYDASFIEGRSSHGFVEEDEAYYEDIIDLVPSGDL